MSKFLKELTQFLKYMGLGVLGLAGMALIPLGMCFVSRHCWETITPEVSFIKDWPRFGYHAFALGVTRVVPISYNWDTHRMEYDYLTIYEKDELFARVHRRATRQGWKRDKANKNSMSYSKPFPVDNHGNYFYQIVKIKYLEGKSGSR